jgi:hypothetical protein
VQLARLAIDGGIPLFGLSAIGRSVRVEKYPSAARRHARQVDTPLTGCTGRGIPLGVLVSCTVASTQEGALWLT